MSAPLQLELHQVGRDAASWSLSADTLINQALHPFNQLGGGQATFGFDRTTEFPVDNVSHVLQQFAQEPFGQRLLSLFLRRLVFVVSHFAVSNTWRPDVGFAVA